MDIRFYNANILQDASTNNIFSGEVWIHDNKIVHVGDSMANDIKWDKEYNLCGNLIMPGFKNCHTHSAMTFLRCLADDLPLDQWLNNRVFPLESKLSHEDIVVFSKIAILEYLTSGITTNFDMYINPHAIAEASTDLEFRTVICGAINNHVQSLELLEECYKKYNNKDSLISYILGCHAEYTTSKEILEGLAALADKYMAPVYLHLSETQNEVDECIKRHGYTPTVFLERLGIYKHGGGGFHGVYMTDEDLDIFKANNLSIVTNPASNAKLASGIAPISAMLEKDINIAIGTDGPASNNCLDMFREMFLVTALAKLRERDASAVSADKVLKMATIGGSKAVNLQHCDTLKEGKLADLIVLDLNQPNMQPINNIVKNIVYSGTKQNVILTMVNGKVLYENQNFHVGIDVEKLYSDASFRVKNLQK